MKHLSLNLILLLVFKLKTYAISITSFFPVSGVVGTSVILTGSGFNSIPASNIVFFGATNATVSAATVSTLTVTVPSSANYLYITVTNLGTNLTAYSAKPFNVTTSCNSSSSFAPAVTFQGGSHNIEICDIDGDGKADLVMPDYFNNYLVVTRNTSTPGSISFAPKIIFPWATGGQPNEVSIGDFDGDGKQDVALGGNGGGTFVSVYRNTSVPGTISFAARADFPASSGQGNGNRIIDIDGDGKPDLLSVHWSGNCLWVLRNTSSGPGIISFAAGVSFATTTQPHKIDVGDLDGDGKPDVVITAFTSNMMSVFRNTSSPGTISLAARQDFLPGTVPYFIHIGDLDNDGKADLAVVNRDVATLAVYRNTSSVGAISFAPRQDFATVAGTMTHYGVAYGDLDGDGKQDIAVGNYTKNVTSIFTNTSVPGSISFAGRVDKPSGVSYDVGIDDFDGDNRPDVAVSNSGSTVSILGNVCTLTPLPIELLDFSAELKNQEVFVHWSTASEINNDYFTLERSSNGIDFNRIGELKGAGTSTTLLDYLFVDKNNDFGLHYYRLKQTDFNGQFSYTSIIAVNSSLGTGIVCIPNPFNSSTSLEFYSSETGPVSIVILDAMGREVKKISAIAYSTDKNKITFDLSALNSAIYFCKIKSNEHVETIRLIKK